ncbi:MAG: hypothetical protein IKT08_06725 [Bacteroidales bacterium]|nr:hypothetical protein [Bacteroidales bacterium]
MEETTLFLEERLGKVVTPEMILGYQYFIGYDINEGDAAVKNNCYELEEKFIDGLKTFPMRIPIPVSVPNNDGAPYVKKNRGYLIDYIENEILIKNNHEPFKKVVLHWARIDVYIAMGDSLEVIVVEENDLRKVVTAKDGSLCKLRLLLSTLMERSKTANTEQPVEGPYVRLVANYWQMGRSLRGFFDPLEFALPLTEEEFESLKDELFNKKLYPVIKFVPKGKEALRKTYGPIELGVSVDVDLASGEYHRILSEFRYLNGSDVRKMQSILDEKGEDVSREELIGGLETCCARKVVFTRETGHLWETYSLLPRTTSKEETDYADTWNDYPVKLKDLSTKFIVDLLKKEKRE